MKKIFFMLPILAVCFASCEKDDSPIIQFKDPKFLDALISIGLSSNEAVDKNADGQISEKEASVVSSLSVEKASIRNLEEIRYFTSLIHLKCGGNQLASLDVSKNTALIQLWCDDNQLTSLDVSNNTALRNLRCDDNQLTSLDVSNNTALTYLDCNNNQLTSLDVSNNTALIYLNCNNNQLTSLDISKVSLQSFREFYCSGNPLTKIIINEKNISDYDLRSIIEEYGEDIIEYVE